jgi:hypothetical protein
MIIGACRLAICSFFDRRHAVAWFVFGLIWTSICSSLVKAEGETAEEFFEKFVRPVLVERCFSCHSERAGKNNGGLQLDSRNALLEGGDSGAAIDLGDVPRSLLLRAIEGSDPEVSKMPPSGDSLTVVEQRRIRSWIEIGAVYPESPDASLDGDSAILK